MTADTETIRELALARGEDARAALEARIIARTITQKDVDWLVESLETLAAENASLRAALGRVEERERGMTGALRRIDFTAGNILRVVEFANNDAETLAGVTFINATDIRAIARAALAGSVAGEEQREDPPTVEEVQGIFRRASAASTSRERLAEGRAEE